MDTALETEKCYYFQEHLSENRELIQRLEEMFLQHRKLIGLFAPCGAGKTHLMLTELAERLRGKKQIFLACPYKIQAEQNRMYGYTAENGQEVHTQVYTGDTRDNVLFDRETPLCGVYECCRRLEGLMADELRDVVFVIDESHLEIADEEFRKIGIQILQQMADLVYDCGGIVVRMTGTPRMLEYMRFDHIFYGVRTDGEGKSLPPVTMKKMAVLYRGSKETNTRSAAAGLCEDLIHDGYRPIFRINDKKLIRIVADYLREKGHTVDQVTADKKGYRMNPDGIREYESPLYQSLIEEAALTDADCWLCTSIIDVGTSITGVRSRKIELADPGSGTEESMIVKDPLIVPVYVITRRDECNLDSIIQFFSRLRYPVEKGIVLICCTAGQENERENKAYSFFTPDAVRKNIRIRAQKCLAYFSGAEDIVYDFVRITGEDCRKYIQRDLRGNYVIDEKAICSETWRRYDGQILDPRFAGRMFREAMDIPVEVGCLENTDRIVPQSAVRIMVPENVKSFLEEAVREPEFREALICPSGMDYRYSAVQKILQAGGKEVLLALRKIFAAGSFSATTALKYAIRWVEEGDVFCLDVHSGENWRISDQIMKDICLSIGEWKDRRVRQFCEAYGSGKEYEFITHLKSEEKLKVEMLLNEKKTGILVAIYNTAGTLRSWKEYCSFVGNNSLQDCRRYLLTIQNCCFNRLSAGGDSWIPELDYRKNVVAAEYMLLRFPERYFLKRESREGKDVWVSEFPEGFKTVDWKLCGYIASLMGEQVNRLNSVDHTRKKYTWPMIMDSLISMYSCEVLGWKKESRRMIVSKIKIRHPRTNVNASIPGTKLTEESMKQAIEEQVCQFRNEDEEIKKAVAERLLSDIARAYGKKGHPEMERIVREGLLQTDVPAPCSSGRIMK